MDTEKQEKEEIALFLSTLLEDRAKIRHVSMDIDYWALTIAQKNDEETGRLFREFFELCRGRYPENKKPSTFASEKALKAMAHANAQRQKKKASALERWDREQKKKAN